MNEANPPQDLLQELEESIPQGVPNDTGFRRRADDPQPEPDVLDVLMAESMEAVEAQAQYKRDREAQKRGFVGMSKEEVEFCNTRLRAFEMAREWEADRAIAVFVGYVCERCDTARVIFSRLMEHHNHRFNRTAHRWITVKDTKLTATTVYDQVDVPMCGDCLEDLGLQNPLDDDVPWLDNVLSGKESEAEELEKETDAEDGEGEQE